MYQVSSCLLTLDKIANTERVMPVYCSPAEDVIWSKTTSLDSPHIESRINRIDDTVVTTAQLPTYSLNVIDLIGGTAEANSGS